MDTITADLQDVVEAPKEVADELETELNEELEAEETETPPDEEEETTEEEEEKGQPKKLTASERVQQAVNEAREAKAEAARAIEAANRQQAEFEAWQAKNKPVEALPYIQLDLNVFERHLEGLESKAEELALSDNPAERIEARRLLRERDGLIAAYEENNRVKTEYENQKYSESQTYAAMQAEETKRMAEFNNAADFYRQKQGITKEVWTAAGAWLDQQFQKDPILLREFQDRAKAQPGIPTIKWLHKIVTEGMGKPAEAAKATKEANKLAQVGGSNATAKKQSTQTLPATDDMSAWVKAREAELKKRK